MSSALQRDLAAHVGNRRIGNRQSETTSGTCNGIGSVEAIACLGEILLVQARTDILDAKD